MIDTTYRLETPEGIDLVISPAGPVSRGLALTIDVLIRQALLLAIGGVLAALGQAGIGIYLVLWFLAEWFYPVVFEVLGNGQTPGKKSIGLRVVNRDGTPIGWSASLIRNLLRAVDFLPAFYLTGIVSVLCTRDFQRLGDLAAGTLVISVREARVLEAPRDVQGAKVSPVPLSADEQRAISSFGERSAELSGQRVVELAELLTALTGKHGDDGATELLQIANGLTGRQ